MRERAREKANRRWRSSFLRAQASDPLISASTARRSNTQQNGSSFVRKEDIEHKVPAGDEVRERADGDGGAGEDVFEVRRVRLRFENQKEILRQRERHETGEDIQIAAPHRKIADFGKTGRRKVGETRPDCKGKICNERCG